MARYIITEQQDIRLKRRLAELEMYLKWALSYVTSSEYNFNDYFEEILWSIRDQFRDKGLDAETTEQLIDFVGENYWKEIETHFLKTRDDEPKED